MIARIRVCSGSFRSYTWIIRKKESYINGALLLIFKGNENDGQDNVRSRTRKQLGTMNTYKWMHD